jgi:photosystem II protein
MAKSAVIQFIRGLDEESIADVRMTRSKDGQTGRAVFIFEEPKALTEATQQDNILGMYLIDEEGELTSREVNAKFVNGKPAGIEAVYNMKSKDQWDRFMRFMNRYATANGLEFSKA